MSSREWLLPGLLVSNHGVEDGEQFSHTSHEGKFFRFAVCEEALIERSDDRVATAGREGHPPHQPSLSRLTPEWTALYG